MLQSMLLGMLKYFQGQNEMDNAEEKVSKFYNTVGWETIDGFTEDARKFEDLRKHSENFVRKCRERIFRHIPDHGENILDMASGPIQWQEYVDYSKNFEKRYCVDLSSKALEMAKRRIGDHGVFLHGSFFDIPLQENFFDCALSIHTIYHMDKDKQEIAVRKLLHVTKPGKPVIILYDNPTVLFITTAQRIFTKVKRMVKRSSEEQANSSLYVHAHPLQWWNRFTDIAEVRIFPCRSFGANIHRRLIPDNRIGSMMLDILFNLEEAFPKFFAKHFQYPMIVLTKKK
jgi:ubiquinone/menaquinone biosynthesis C-methylase UbiE